MPTYRQIEREIDREMADGRDEMSAAMPTAMHVSGDNYWCY